jgi:DegV family protein with EDD domain
MSIKIVVDSACDLPAAYLRDNGITNVPLFINIGEQSYLDGVDISREAFYQNLPDFSEFPKTAAPGPEVFRKVYENLAVNGAEEILSIHIASALSNTVSAARLGAEETKGGKVTVIDTEQLSMGTGLLVITALKALQEGKSSDEIAEIISEKTKRTFCFVALDTLEYLKRSGRINVASASLGTLLKMKPVVTLHRGKPEIERVRTAKKAMAAVVEKIIGISPLEEIHFLHSNAEARLEQLILLTKSYLPSNKERLRTNVSPVLGAHLGPGMIGFACVSK